MPECTCKEHSGIEARIAEAKNQTDKQWDEIHGIKKILIGIFFSTLIGLLAIIGQLLLLLTGHP